ncbi:cache domain-containing protein [Methanoregula sp.]|uniref:cache domain-containing protein n=1 Tax=Methanoregula sp. TaxID=2052170 RepID=UPI0035639392
MKAASSSLLCVLVLGLFLSSAGCTQPQSDVTPSTPVSTAIPPQGNYTTNETLVAFVDSAVAYVKAQGKEKALVEFSNPNGSFIRGELYIYAYDFNGTTLAHPVNPEAVGKKREGANGIFVTDMGNVVRNGSGFYPFVYVNPKHNRTLETKLGYGVKVDDTWWLGSGIYTGPVEPAVASSPNAPLTYQEIKDFVDNAAAYAQKNGKAAALSAFSNKSGPFVVGDVYIYALDYSGHALALLYQPQLVGTSFYNLQDNSGRYYTRTEIALAKSGGGYLLYQYPDPSDNFTVKYKISYVRPVDDTYWIGAGIYTSEDMLVDQELRQFVADAKAYAKTYGKEKAVAGFNNVNGSFIKDDLYVFSYDYNGTVLSWPYRPDQIGTNRLNATDPLGTHHVQAMLNGARNGTAMVEYYSVNPATNTTELKISYVTDVDGTWMLGAGRYMEPGPVILRK